MRTFDQQSESMKWDRVWAGVAAQFDGYCRDGLQDLLTEDVLRFCTIQQLADAGYKPIAWRFSGVGRGFLTQWI